MTFASRKCSISRTIKKAYFLHFGCKVGDQDKKWAPHVCCTTCSSKHNAWVNGKGRCMPFGVPMVWRVPSNHSTYPYFCMVLPIQNGMSMKKKSTLVYPNIPSDTVKCYFATSTYRTILIQGGSNMTGTDLCVNKSHCAAAVRP